MFSKCWRAGAGRWECSALLCPGTAVWRARASLAPKVAALLQEELGDDAQAWDAFAGKVTRLAPNAVKSLTVLIDEVRGGTTSA